MINGLVGSMCLGYEKLLCSAGFDIENFKDSLFRDKMFTDNLKLLSCKLNFSDYLSPEKSMLLAIFKQTFLLYKINKFKKGISVVIINTLPGK